MWLGAGVTQFEGEADGGRGKPHPPYKLLTDKTAPKKLLAG